MSETAPAALDLRYARRALFGYAAVFLLIAYGGIGMVTGAIEIAPQQRLQQVAIGFGFLAFAALLGAAILDMLLYAGRPVVTLDAKGLWDRRLTQSPIPWAAIAHIEAAEPALLERLVLPAGMQGRVIVCLDPVLGSRIELTGTPGQRLMTGLFSRPGRLRLFQRTLDLPYPVLVMALEQRCRVERWR